MSAFKNILFATDLKERNCVVFGKAARVAKANNAELTAATVLKDIPFKCVNKATGMSEEKVNDLFIKAREEEIENMLCKQDDIDFKKLVLVGSPYVEIIKDVVANKRDLVMLSAKKKSKLHHLIFGSTAMKLIRYCPCPVWVMRPEYVEKSKNIMVALDFNIYSEKIDTFSLELMEDAITLARANNAKLHIFHSWFLHGESVLRTTRAAVKSEDVKAMLDNEKQLHQKKLDMVLAECDLSGIDYEVHLVKGDPDDAIVECAEKSGVDLLIMGSIARSGVEGLFLGNTAETVLNKIDTSILTVKPSGFKTPIS